MKTFFTILAITSLAAGTQIEADRRRNTIDQIEEPNKRDGVDRDRFAQIMNDEDEFSQTSNTSAEDDNGHWNDSSDAL